MKRLSKRLGRGLEIRVHHQFILKSNKQQCLLPRAGHWTQFQKHTSIMAKSFLHGSHIPQWKIDCKLERKIKTINKQWIACCCDHVYEGNKQRNIKQSTCDITLAKVVMRGLSENQTVMLIPEGQKGEAMERADAEHFRQRKQQIPWPRGGGGAFSFLQWILSYNEMKQPWVYMCSPSQSPLPPPSPPTPSRSSQCTRSKRLSHASNLGW